MIEVKNLTKKYGDFIAVDDVSFNVSDGEVFAFLGPNGAGKSTTIKMLTTLLHPNSGSITLNNIDPVKEPEQARRTFGIVFQDPSLDDDLTAWENMDLHGVLYDVPDMERRQRSEELLRFVDLWDRKDSPVKEFSGGMKRRLEIARGLLHKPKILFLMSRLLAWIRRRGLFCGIAFSNSIKLITRPFFSPLIKWMKPIESLPALPSWITVKLWPLELRQNLKNKRTPNFSMMLFWRSPARTFAVKKPALLTT